MVNSALLSKFWVSIHPCNRGGVLEVGGTEIGCAPFAATI